MEKMTVEMVETRVDILAVIVPMIMLMQQRMEFRPSLQVTIHKETGSGISHV
ncbi:MAG: hypothetical protein ACLSGB_09385 [Dorea sp.]